MVLRLCLAVLALCLVRPACSASDRPVRDLPALRELLTRPADSQERRFDVTAVVVSCPSHTTDFLVQDGDCYADLYRHDASVLPPTPGDLVRATGNVVPTNVGPQAHVFRLEVLRHDAPPPPKRCSLEDAASGRHCLEYICVEGEVLDAYYDDIDSRFSFLMLGSGSEVLYVPVFERPPLSRLYAYVGDFVSVSGICHKACISRPFQRCEISLSSLNDVIVLASAPQDPFDAPDLFDGAETGSALRRPFSRRRACGRVLVTWGGKLFLIRTRQGTVVKVDVLEGPLPDVGTCVDVVGLPDYNAYTADLLRCRWRSNGRVPTPPGDRVSECTIRQLFFDDGNRPRIDVGRYGRPLRVRGTVRGLANLGDDNRLALLEDDNVFVHLRFDAARKVLDRLPVGSRVEVTATCVYDFESQQSRGPAQKILNTFLVLGADEDLRVVARPPWWTPGRLFALVAVLVLGLAVITIWNRRLRGHIERRSRELLDEQIAHVSSELKTLERTRLAIELHDSIAQNLTGVALELQTVQDLIAEDAATASRHLAAASGSLQSCRQELRNCLYDLRCDALEVPDVTEAIRITLSPHLGKTNVSIRFNVPRDRISDSTMHVLLCVIRELVLNAIRHGRATAVKIAGTVDGGILLLSVTDNGTGFDVENRPGIAEGHFGLQGILDRIESLDGKMTIESEIGRGTRAAIAFTLARENNE